MVEKKKYYRGNGITYFVNKEYTKCKSGKRDEKENWVELVVPGIANANVPKTQVSEDNLKTKYRYMGER